MVKAQRNFARHDQRIELLVDDVEAEMQPGVACRADADAPPQRRQKLPVQHGSQRGDGQRGEQEIDRPIARAVGELADRPSAQIAGQPKHEQSQSRGDQYRQRDAAAPGKTSLAVSQQRCHAKSPLSPLS
jgi:hypothetical protein